MKTDLRKLQDAVAEWAEAQFPGQTIKGKINHLRRELDELEAALAPGRGNFAIEAADCQNLLIHIAKLAGISAEAHIENCFTKLDICKRRAWPAQPDPDGVYHHIPDGARASSPAAIPETVAGDGKPCDFCGTPITEGFERPDGPWVCVYCNH